MKSLKELLPVEDRPVDYRDPEYIARCLSDLPATAAIEADFAEMRARRDAAPEGSREREWAERDLQNRSWQISRAAQRDELAAERPAGCWCLGIGGRKPRYTQDHLRVFSELCECTEGIQTKQTQDRQIAEALRARHAARAKRLFDEACIPSRFTTFSLDTYPVSDRSRTAFDAVKYWIDGPDVDVEDALFVQWEQRKKSLLLHGSFGTGKTGLAVGILRATLMDNDGGLFFTVPTLLDHIRRTYAPNPVADEHEVVQTVKNAPLLVLDDLGAERVTEWVREKLFTIINHRHDEDLPTVFTSNLDIAELGQHIGERTTWRIVEMCQVIHVDGPNLRNTGA